MANYLLLRNNLKEGPFQLQQLLEKGLKPYDLVWVEGKSAAWRYPTELEELKKYCNWEEEQPFDRFYKKTDASTPVVQQAIHLEEHNPHPATIPGIHAHAMEHAAAHQHVAIILPTSKKYVAIDNTKVAAPIFKDRLHYTSSETGTPIGTSNTHKTESVESHKPLPFSKTPQTPSAPKRPFRKTGIMLAGMLLLLSAGIIIGISLNKMAIAKNDNSNQSKPLPTITQNVTKGLRTMLPVEETATPTLTNELSLPDETIENNTTTKTLVPTNLSANQKSKKRIENKSVSMAVSEDENKALSVPDQKETPSSKPVFKGKLTELVQLSHNKYKIGAFGGVNHLDISVNNASQYTLSEVHVEIQYLLANNKLFKKETLVFETLKPGVTVVKEAPKSNRGVKIEMLLTEVSSAEVDIQE